MYIDPFWAGVFATIAAEFVTVIIAAVTMSIKKK